MNFEVLSTNYYIENKDLIEPKPNFKIDLIEKIKNAVEDVINYGYSNPKKKADYEDEKITRREIMRTFLNYFKSESTKEK